MDARYSGALSQPAVESHPVKLLLIPEWLSLYSLPEVWLRAYGT